MIVSWDTYVGTNSLALLRENITSHNISQHFSKCGINNGKQISTRVLSAWEVCYLLICDWQVAVIWLSDSADPTDLH